MRRRRHFARAAPPSFSKLAATVGSCAEAIAAARVEGLAGSGIGPAARRLLACLEADGPRAVPVLAAKLGVTRQAVQPVVDALADAGRVEALPNALNRRSPLVRLTEAGRVLLQEIAAREAALDARLATRFLARDVFLAQVTLANLRRAYTVLRRREDG